MKIETLHYGEVDVDERYVIDFEAGIPGFPELRRFALVEPEAGSLFWFMQSVEDAAVSFLIVNPFVFYPSYEFELDESNKRELELNDPSELLLYCIVSTHGSVQHSTINLLAPVVINSSNRRGKQIILHDSPYQPRHPLFQPQPMPARKEEV